MASSTRWRLYITGVGSGGYIRLQELEMRLTAGGATQCTGGTASASSVASGSAAADAFDGNVSGTAWLPSNTLPAPDWIEYQFSSTQAITEYAIYCYLFPNNCPTDFKLQYYNGSTWVDADVRTGQTFSTFTWNVYTVSAAVTLQPSLLTNTNTFYAPVVKQPQILTPSLFTDANTFYAPFVANGKLISAPLLTSTNTFYAPRVIANQKLTPSLFSEANIFYAPTVITRTINAKSSVFNSQSTLDSYAAPQQAGFSATSTLNAYTTFKVAFTTLSKLDAYQSSTAVFESQSLLNAYSSQQTEFTIQAQLAAYVASSSQFLSQSALSAYVPQQSAFVAQNALSVYSALRAIFNAASAMPVYSNQQGKFTAQTALNAYTPSQTTFGVDSAILVYANFSSVFSVQSALGAYSGQSGQFNSLSNLNVYTPYTSLFNAQSVLGAYTAEQAQFTVQSALAAIEKFYAWAVNLDTKAVSKYDNYNFNKLSGGLGSNSDGIFALYGDTDNGVPVNGFVESGRELGGVNSSMLKRVTDIYLGVEGGKLNLNIDTDTGAVDYKLDASQQLGPVKVNLARGAKGRYWKFTLSNDTGSKARISTIELNVEPLSRKV